MSSIAKRIRQARNSCGLSQERLAERMGVSRGACGHWERGVASPSTEHLALLAQILNVDLDWLLTGKNKSDQQNGIADAATVRYSLPSKDDETSEVAERFYRLSKKKRKIILELLREL